MNIFQFSRAKSGLYVPFVQYARDWGTAVDYTTGDRTFGLYPGSGQYWLNPSGNDANSGLNPSAAKASLNAAVTGFLTNWGALGGGTTAPRLMIAGTGGRSYTDSGAGDTFAQGYLSGLSKQYPVVVQSYDPADPTNQSKWGNLHGADMPEIVYNTGVCALAMANDTFNGYIAYHGLSFNSSDAEGANDRWAGVHLPLCWQHCRFIDYMTTITGNSRYWPNHDNLIAQCAFIGGWANSGNMSGTFIAAQTKMRIEDSAYIHNGWRRSGSRDAVGGANIFGHGSYNHSDPLEPYQISRIIYIDPAADDFNCRGSGILNCIASIDSPFHVIGGASADTVEEMPLGSLIQITDLVSTGGSNISTASGPRFGISIQNTQPGSFIKNSAFFDSSGFSGPFHVIARAAETNAIDPTFLFDGVRSYNFGDAGTMGADPAQCHTLYKNSRLGQAILPALDGGGNTTWSGAPAGYKSQSQAIAAMGYGDLSKNYLARLIAEYPHLAGAFSRAYVTIGLQSLGLQPQTFPATSPPDVSGLPAPRALTGY